MREPSLGWFCPFRMTELCLAVGVIPARGKLTRCRGGLLAPARVGRHARRITKTRRAYVHRGTRERAISHCSKSAFRNSMPYSRLARPTKADPSCVVQWLSSTDVSITAADLNNPPGRLSAP